MVGISKDGGELSQAGGKLTPHSVSSVISHVMVGIPRLDKGHGRLGGSCCERVPFSK